MTIISPQWDFLQWASCQIRKIASCACAGNAGNVFPRHHALAIPTCITACAWRTCSDACRDHKLAVSFEIGGGENVPSIPGLCAICDLRIWQEAHGKMTPLYQGLDVFMMISLLWGHRCSIKNLGPVKNLATPPTPNLPYLPQGSYGISVVIRLTHWQRGMHICLSELDHHWFIWLVAWPVASHYLNQCWVTANWTLRNKLQWNLNRNLRIYIQENALEYRWVSNGVTSFLH